MTTPATPKPSASDPGITYTPQSANNGMANNPFYLPTTTDTTYLTQTSPQDITSLVNATMQSLVGRNATPQEIQQYGAELLAAERTNTGQYTGETTYAISGKRNTVTGQQLTTGVDPQGFLQSIIKGTGEAKAYNVMNTYMSTLQQMTDQFKGSYNG